MSNIITGLKRFLANKNTVTILGVVLAIFVLYVAYNYRINQETTPVRVPYAKVTIQPKTEITEDMVGYMDVPRKALQGNIITSARLVIGEYSNYNTIIPVGSMFYKETVVSFESLPDSAFSDVKEGYTVYNFPVDMESTYGNSLFPGNYIDIYFKGINDSGEVMYGQLFKNIKILAVKTNKGESVFRSSEEFGTPAMLLFAVPNDMYLTLKKAVYLTVNDSELIVVPVTEEVKTTPGVTSTFLVDFINAKTSSIPQDQIDAASETTEETETSETE